ncbi:hypothetical protein C8Q75DRAFT_715566 [Abortiporus biennis]|nr:hypothetical protein C8Q75DRAFT_715566 [Abortiporus biennis]
MNQSDSVAAGSENPHGVDLVGTPFAVLESDPGLFTMLVRKLGFQHLEVTEIYDIEPWAVDHLDPIGLIFCYLCTDDTMLPDADEDDIESEYDIPDPDIEDTVWFAHQLSDDACATQAILNVLLNYEDVQLDENIRRFKEDTEKMSSVMRGLALTNCSFIREAHNSLARPCDIRAAQYSLATRTLDLSKKSSGNQSSPATKKRKSTKTQQKKTVKKVKNESENVDSYHFIGYVPRNGKVYEIDGLRISGPVEVGEIPQIPSSSSLPNSKQSRRGWIDIVRPALKLRMQKWENIQYNLLAIVADKFEKASDELEMLKRERIALERRLNTEFGGEDGWKDKVDYTMVASSSSSFSTSLQPSSLTLGPTFSSDFGSLKLQKDIAILDMPTRNLAPAWEKCVQASIPAKVAVEEEISRSVKINTEHLSRTFDYEPFIQTFVTRMHEEGLLENAMSGKNGRHGKATATPSKKTNSTKRKTKKG